MGEHDFTWRDGERTIVFRVGALADTPVWEQPALENALKSFAESEGVGLGKFGPALRGVLSGGHPAPDLASTLAALGPDEGLARIDDALCAAQ